MSFLSIEIILEKRNSTIERCQVDDTLYTVVNMAFHKVVAVERSNLTSLVANTKKLVSYLKSPKRSNPDWTVFKFGQRWRETFEETLPQARLNM